MESRVPLGTHSCTGYKVRHVLFDPTHVFSRLIYTSILTVVPAHIPPDLMIPPRRLATLLNQALERQRDASFYYAQPSTSTSLLSDVKADRSQFPLVQSARLQHHEDEVWNIAWSHSGEYLASVGKDKLVIIWKIGVSVGL